MGPATSSVHLGLAVAAAVGLSAAIAGVAILAALTVARRSRRRHP